MTTTRNHTIDINTLPTESITIHSFTLGGYVGTEGRSVTITASARDARMPGAQRLEIVGVAPLAAKEIAVRVRSALEACGHVTAGSGATVLAVAHGLPPKPVIASALDLPIALALIALSRPDREPSVGGLLIAGELGLDGKVRPIRGILAACELARAQGRRGVLVASDNAREALEALAPDDGVAVYALAHLRDLEDALRKPLSWELSRARSNAEAAKRAAYCEFSDVRGQPEVVERVVAAVTRHLTSGAQDLSPMSLSLVGPPGTGKTMIARRITTLMPEMCMASKLTVTRYYSTLGLARGLIEERPFRAPHHTISNAALVGGQRPGEVHLAAHGVLFLDELVEFRIDALRAIRGAIADMPRVQRPMVVVAASACPCGWVDSSVRECKCTESARASHVTRLNACLDALCGYRTVMAFVTPLSIEQYRDAAPGPSSVELRKRVIEAIETTRVRMHHERHPEGCWDTSELERLQSALRRDK